MKENFNWFIENIKYSLVTVGSENFEKNNLPEYVKNKIYNDALSHSFIIWYLKNENLFGIKYNQKEVIINLDNYDKFLYITLNEKGKTYGGKIILFNKSGERKSLVSGSPDLLDKISSVIRIWFGNRIEYINGDDYTDVVQ